METAIVKYIPQDKDETKKAAIASLRNRALQADKRTIRELYTQAADRLQAELDKSKRSVTL